MCTRAVLCQAAQHGDSLQQVAAVKQGAEVMGLHLCLPKLRQDQGVANVDDSAKGIAGQYVSVTDDGGRK